VGENPPAEQKPRGVIHWVSASHGKRATVRLYNRLFNHEAPDSGDNDFMNCLNPDSLQVLDNCWVEQGLVDAPAEQAYQFEREGYFVADRYDHTADTPVFNQTIGLREDRSK
jgi:glutaminyl-tRNA synthetase